MSIFPVIFNSLSQRETQTEIIVGLIMSNNVEDERRLYQCAKKYEKMVKQFDELIEMMNTRTTREPKRRRGSRGSSSSAAPASSSQPDNNEVFVQTITRFLHDLKLNPTDPDCSTITRD